MSEAPSPQDLPDPTLDIAPVLATWEYEPGTLNVRRIVGGDGRPKLQMRLELGLLQMEITGRPDGRRPHGFESLLEYHEQRIAEHRQSHAGTAEGFALSPDECQRLREEAAMYYQRYLSMFMLGDFPAVVRDTTRNLRVLDLCSRYSAEEQDRLLLEQYRPYIIMMRTRAGASLLFQNEQPHQAVDEVRVGLRQIRAFFDRFGHPEAYDGCEEVKILKRFGRQLKRKLPVSKLERLQRRLKKAVHQEQYELAADLRDQITALEAQPNHPPG